MTKRQETLNPTEPVFTSFIPQAVHLHQAYGASATGAEFTSRFGFFVFRATRTAIATGTVAQKAYFSFFLRGMGRFEGTTAASCERSIGLPIFISVGHMRTAYRSQGILLTLPLERPRGGSQEKTAASSVSERNETADSEYCRLLQSPRRIRTRSIMAKRHPDG